MGWAVGYDETWGRDIGYGVPAYCDHPKCGKEIDRGLAYVCGRDPYGGEKGCGLFFCVEHQGYPYQRCSRCRQYRPPYTPKPEHPDWLRHKLTDASWEPWRQENPNEVAQMAAALTPGEPTDGR